MSQSVEIYENDRKSLECPICKDFLKVPKVVRCSHVFCESCLTNYLEQSECNFPPCPVCRERIVLPQIGMQGFRTEQFYQDIAERLKEKDELSKNITTGMCGLCKKTSELESKCLTCTCVICKQCMPSHNALKPHCTVVALSEIDNVDEDELMSQRKVVCNLHDTELLNLYCHDCNKIICLFCKVADTVHADHTCEPLHTRGKFCRDYLKTARDEISKLTKEAAAASFNVDAIFDDFSKNLQDVTNKVNTKIDTFIAELNGKREMFLRSLEEKRKEINLRLQRQKNKMETVKTEGQALIEMTNKAIRHGNDADVATLQNDLQQQISKLKRYVKSSLHKDFRIKVDFLEDEYYQSYMTQQISEYDIGNVSYSQVVGVKAWKDTTMTPDVENIPYAAMASPDSLCMIYKMKGYLYLYTDYSKILYTDTYDQTTASIEYKKQILNGTYSLPVVNEEFTNVRFYDPCFVKESKESVWIRNERIEKMVGNGIIENSPYGNVKTEIGDVDKNDQDEILIVGKFDECWQHCTVVKRDGTHKFTKHFLLDQKASESPRGSFDIMGNVLVTHWRSDTKIRELVLLNTDTEGMEKLIMPSLSDGHILQPEVIYEKCDGLLYTTVTNGSKILTLSYLP